MESGSKGSVGTGRGGVVAAAWIVFSFLAFPVRSQNLVLNGNFEAGGGGFAGWQISHDASQTQYYGPNISTGGYNDPYYARFTFEPEGDDTLSQELATTPGDEYAINFWAEDGDGHNFGAEMNFGTFSADLLSSFDNSPGGPSGWQDFSYDVTATELDTDFSFVIAADEGSEFGVDDISVTPVPDFEGIAVGNRFHVTVSTPAGYSTIIQASTNLIGWACVYTNTPPFTFTDSMTQFPHRFYRAAIVVQQSQ